jgi:hypothetical protein
MTSICQLRDAQISMREFSTSMQRSFARVFGYDTIVAQAPAQIWQQLDSPRAESQAQS